MLAYLKFTFEQSETYYERMMNMRILVYKDGELDGIAYKETNEYVKAKEHSFFERLTNIPVNYLIIEKFILFRECITSLDQ